MSHWLVGAARRGGLEVPEKLSVTGDVSLDEAWSAVARGCGSSQDELAEAVARAFRTEVADFDLADSTARRLVPGEVARKFMVFPLRENDRQLVAATADPVNMEAEQTLGFCSGRNPQFEIAPPGAVREQVENAYAPERAVETFLESSDLAGDDDADAEVQLLEVTEDVEGSPTAEDLGSGPVVRLVNLILKDAVESRSSDIHIQPTASGGVVRLRVDGVLRTVLQFPTAVLLRVTSRLKVMGQLDIADRLRPQDGRFRVAVGGSPYDFRLSTVPVRGAEKAVIRILDSEATPSLEDLHMPEPELQRLRKLLGSREGIIAVTGPTGSGKTTTLYAALDDISSEDVNIMTVEDPVEYELPGVTQIQVESKQGVGFGSALRAILRQDPDVILVGEVRDEETAEMAVQASMTGHLVLTTLHTNDALGAIRRLNDLGVDLRAITESVKGALAQRLIRRVCPDCVVEIDGDLSEAEKELQEKYRMSPKVRPVGCASCGHTGYRGRMLVLEVLVVTSELQELILEEASPGRLWKVARRQGMRSMREVALERVRNGHTTLEEVERVMGDLTFEEEAEAAEAEEAEAKAGAKPSAAEGEAEAEAAGGAPGEEDVTVPPSTGARAKKTPEDLGTARILVVDDDGAARTIARAVLEKNGFEVDEAADGVQAVQLLDLGKEYDLLVLDLDMPRMGGRGVLERVRNSPASAFTPVIVLTGTAGQEAEVELMEAGADDYLRKPLEPARFLSRVRATLRRATAFA